VLETLLAYNVADVLNLAALAPSVVNRKIADTPFADALLPEPRPLSNPYTAHRAILDRYRDRVLG
jgi:hypothetical protein